MTGKPRIPHDVQGSPWKLDAWLRQRGLPTLPKLEQPAKQAIEPDKPLPWFDEPAGDEGESELDMFFGPRRRKPIASKPKASASKKKHLDEKKTENLVKRFLESRRMTVKKIPTYTYTDSRGIERQKSIDVDFHVETSRHHLRVEAKGASIRGGRGAWALSNLNPETHVRFLNEALRDGYIPAIALCWWTRDGVDRCELMHYIPWELWGIVISRLQLKADREARFKGKSIRYHADLDILRPYAVEKVRGRWVVHEEHWLQEYIE